MKGFVYTLLIILLLSATTLSAQYSDHRNRKTDSLESVLKSGNALSDNDLIRAYIGLMWGYLQTDGEKSEHYAQKALELSHKTNALNARVDALDDLQVVGLASTLNETAEMLSRIKPQVLLLDVALPDGDGIDAVPNLLSISDKTKIVVLSMFAEASVIRRAMKAGAVGYLFKSVGSTEIHKAIQMAAAGETCLCDEAQRLLNETEVSSPILTMREREILGLIAEGCTMKEIADRLCLGFETVHSYTKNLRQKLGCNNTASLVRAAIGQHLI